MPSSFLIIQKQLLVDEQLQEYEIHIENLQQQQKILQNISFYVDLETGHRLDFGDFIETNNLIEEQIQRLREEIKQKRSCLPISGERGLGEEEVSSSSTLNKEEYLLKYKHHKDVTKALNKVLQQEEGDKKICVFCNCMKSIKEFSTKTICLECDDLIGSGLKIAEEEIF